MKLTTLTMVTVDGVMQGLGAPDEDRRGGFERGGWSLPLHGTTPATRGIPIRGKGVAVAMKHMRKCSGIGSDRCSV